MKEEYKNYNDGMCEVEHKTRTMSAVMLQGNQEPVIHEIYVRAKCFTKDECLAVMDRFFGEKQIKTKKVIKKKNK